MSARLNVLRLRRGRTVGIGLLAVMGFLIFGFVFLVNEPLIIEVTEDFDLEICPPYCDEAFLEIPIPEFDVPIEITFRPIITTTDSNGVEDVIRGELTFLQAISGLTVIQVGVPEKTFENGNLKIELEFETGNIFSREIFGVKPAVSIIGNDGIPIPTIIPSKEKQTPRLEGGSVISVIGLEIAIPDCNVELPCIIGGTSDGIFTINIFDSAILEGQQRGVSGFVDPNVIGQQKFDFILTTLEVNIQDDFAVGIGLPDLISFPLPEPLPVSDPLPELLSIVLPEDTQTRIEPAEFVLAESVQIYSVTFANVELATELIMHSVNATEVVIEEVIVEDIPNSPCPDVKFDSISYLYPTDEISGTTTILNQTPEDFDFANVDVRNNRNCDLDIAIGSKWRSTTGEVFVSDISQINILTNQTIPFRSLPFDSNTACAGFTCSGQEIEWCFFGQVSTTDPIEIIDEFCGKKFYR